MPTRRFAAHAHALSHGVAAALVVGLSVVGQGWAQPRSDPGTASDVQAPSSSFPPPRGSASATPAAELDQGESSSESSELPALGLMLDAGLPDGLMVSGAYRPFFWLKAHGGAGTNSISPGVRVGLSIIPVGMGPSLTLEAGHYFEGDANGFAQGTFGTDEQMSEVLQRFDYDFANAHLGLEFGQERFVFFIHGGISYMRTTVRNANSLLRDSGESSGEPVTFSINQDPTISAVVPSAKLGLLAYIL